MLINTFLEIVKSKYLRCYISSMFDNAFVPRSRAHLYGSYTDTRADEDIDTSKCWYLDGVPSSSLLWFTYRRGSPVSCRDHYVAKPSPYRDSVKHYSARAGSSWCDGISKYESEVWSSIWIFLCLFLQLRVCLPPVQISLNETRLFNNIRW